MVRVWVLAKEGWGGGGPKPSSAFASSRNTPVKTMPATPYESTWSSRTLAATLPSTSARLSLIRPALAVKAAPRGGPGRPKTTQDGIIISNAEATRGDSHGGGGGGGLSMLKELAFVQVGASGSKLGSSTLLRGGGGAPSPDSMTDDLNDARSTLTSAGSFRPCGVLQPKAYGGPRAADMLKRFPLLTVAGEGGGAPSP